MRVEDHGNMELVYYVDHDVRYAHIHPKDRGKYPDEIRRGFMSSVIKRTKPAREITLKDIIDAGNVDTALLACDRPYTEGLIH